MEALQQIRALARQFSEEQIRPHVERWDAAGAFDDDILTQLGELGFLGMLVPESAGGMELDRAAYVGAVEELAWGDASIALAVVLHSTVAAALFAGGRTEDAARLATGELLGTMPVAPSDDEPLREGEGTLSGRVRWVAIAARAGLLLIPGPAAAATEARLVALGERAAAGNGEETLGLRPLRLAVVQLDDAPVVTALPFDPALDDGAAGVLCTGVAAAAVGIAQAALEHARDYAAEREQFGRALRTFEGMQFKLADMATRVWSARALLERAAAGRDAGLSSAAKVVASEAATAVTTQAVQVFGGYGYMRDYPVEKLMRDAKATELMAEPNERHRVRIARGLYEG
jgi:hypothetical protein